MRSFSDQQGDEHGAGLRIQAGWVQFGDADKLQFSRDNPAAPDCVSSITACEMAVMSTVGSLTRHPTDYESSKKSPNVMGTHD